MLMIIIVINILKNLEVKHAMIPTRIKLGFASFIMMGIEIPR